VQSKPVRPSVFIGSSTEGLAVARAIQVLLDHTNEVELWSQGVFGLTQGTLESLVLGLEHFDFAVLVLTAEDLTMSRGAEHVTARDNVVFELGLFVGGIGRDRTFMVYDRSQPPSLPSDLAGVGAATFEPHSSGNLEAALGAACTRIQAAIDKLGVCESRQARLLADATDNMEDAGARMQELIRLIARSRAVELDIISAQFGPLIDPSKLAMMKQDLRDLEATLDGGSV